MRALKVVEQIAEPEIAEAESWNGRLQMALLAPNGVQKLRELILDLAMSGKLVSQNHNDIPASKLVENILKKKTQRKKNKADEFNISDNEKIFPAPHGWEWVKVGKILTIIRGASPRPKGDPRYFSNKRTKFHWVKISDFRKHGENGILKDTDEFLTKDGTEKTVLVKAGTLIITNSATIGVPMVMGMDGYIHDGFLAFPDFPHNEIDQSFFFMALQNLTSYLKKQSRGLAQLNMNSGIMRDAPFCLPPLEEQKRIVLKFKDLTLLCDKLEAQKEDASSAHEALVKTVLSTLTQSQSAKEFQENWQRIAKNFNILFTTETSIDALKQTILQLAVMGKLVPQNSKDVSATKLLERIKSEKEKLVKAGKIKKDKPLPEIADDEKPYNIPDNWQWSRIGSYSLFTEYGLSEKTFDTKDGVPVLKMGDIQGGKILLGGQKKVSENCEGLPGAFLLKNDLLYNRTNSAELVGKTGIYEGEDKEYTFASYLIRIRCSETLSNPYYLNLAMNAPMFRETQIVPHIIQQCGQANVNGTILKNMLVPIPPLEEQNRIVDMVDELLSICDNLKSRLIKFNFAHENLANALVERAVAA